MSATALVRSLPKQVLAPVSRFHLHPKIVLETCAWCVGGTYRIGSREFRCTQCAGHGTIVLDNA